MFWAGPNSMGRRRIEHAPDIMPVGSASHTFMVTQSVPQDLTQSLSMIVRSDIGPCLAMLAEFPSCLRLRSLEPSAAAVRIHEGTSLSPSSCCHLSCVSVPARRCYRPRVTELLFPNISLQQPFFSTSLAARSVFLGPVLPNASLRSESQVFRQARIFVAVHFDGRKP